MVERVLFLTPLSEALVQLGQFDRALPLLHEAMGIVNANDDPYFESECHRLEGLCLLGMAAGNAQQAGVCFNEALALSRKQGARSLELAAATSLARLWHTQGKAAQAKALLEDIRG